MAWLVASFGRHEHDGVWLVEWLCPALLEQTFSQLSALRTATKYGTTDVQFFEFSLLGGRFGIDLATTVDILYAVFISPTGHTSVYKDFVLW